MAETDVRLAPPHRTDFDPLRWIGAYKLLKAVLAVVGGLSLPMVALAVSSMRQTVGGEGGQK